jgi:hypothetical protein
LAKQGAIPAFITGLGLDDARLIGPQAFRCSHATPLLIIVQSLDGLSNIMEKEPVVLGSHVRHSSRIRKRWSMLNSRGRLTRLKPSRHTQTR